MPRPVTGRELASEKNVAQRVAYEREQRGWSYAGLALRMTKAGCKIDQSALYKIEKADPPRRITVDELVGFAEVFGLTLVELTTPLDTVISTKMQELLANCRRDYESLRDSTGAVLEYMSSPDRADIIYRQKWMKTEEFALVEYVTARFASSADAT